ncbi:MAG TPA: tetratricopeptide repeat protein [Nevskia sp.]|nr:tetratricopeptide repeat protein [Nevskia sp.]
MLAALCSLTLLLGACGGSAERKASYIAHGRKYLEQQNYDKARIEFRNALQIDPKDAKAHYGLAQAAEKLQDARTAAGEYQAAVDLDPKYSDARAALARLYVLFGLPDKALELVAPGLAAEPDNARLLVARGAAKAMQGDMSASAVDAEAAVRLAPNDDYAIALLASVDRARGDSDKAVEVVRKGLQQLPGDFDLHLMLADLLQGQGHLDQAEAELKQAVALDPKNLEHRYFLVRFYQTAKNDDAAEKELREIIVAAPADPRPKLMLVRLLEEHRGAAPAGAELEKFTKAEPDNEQFRMALADNLRRQNRPDQAQATYREVIASAGVKPEGLEARDQLAELLIDAGDPRQAQTLLAEVLKENPADHDALIMRANLALARGDAPAAITDLRTVLHDQPNALPVLRTLARAHLQNNEPALAIEVLRTALQATPGDAEVKLDLAQALERQGRPEQALPLLEQLQADTPDNLRLVDLLFQGQLATHDLAAARGTAQKFQLRHPELPLGYYLGGLADEKEQKTDAAIAGYERALKAAPDAAEPLAALVRIDLLRKQPGRALQRLDALIGQHPDDVYARGLKGEVLLSQSQPAAAAQAFQEAIDRQPAFWTAYRGLARARLAQKQDDAAAQALADGIARNPDAGALVTELAELDLKLGRPDQAIAVYEEALKRHPGSMLFANNLAMVLVTTRQDQASLQRARELAAQIEDSADPSFMDTRGWVSFKNGSYKDAQPLLQQAADRAPQDPVLRYHLGMVQFRNGDTASARANLEAAIKSGRSFGGLDEARATLDQVRHQLSR